MRPTEAECAKQMEGKRIALVSPANIRSWDQAPQTLYLIFTDGTRAVIEAESTEEAEPSLSFEVGHWRAGVLER